jgi:hypothetical protein
VWFVGEKRVVVEVSGALLDVTCNCIDY